MNKDSAQPSVSASAGRRVADRLGFAAFLAAGVFVAALSWTKLGSVDTGYHVAYGRHFLEHGQIVERDPFLYPENAVPFVNANWGSQVVMALAEKAAGAGGLVALRSLLLAIVFVCIAILLRRRGVSWGWIAAAWMLTGVAAYERFSERPELFSYAVMAALLLVLSRGVRSWRGVAALCALQLAWVNLHSYFLVGLMLTGTALAAEGLRWWQRRRAPEAAVIRRSTRLLAAALAVQVAVCFVNPWHYRGAIFPVQTLRYLKERGILGGEHDAYASERSWSAISEFHSPFSFVGERVNGRTIHAYLLLLGVAGLGVIAAGKAGRWGEALAILAMALMSTQMRRNIAQFAIVAGPLALAAIHEAAVRAGVRSRSGAMRSIAAVLMMGICAWWTVGLVTGRFYYAERRINREFGAGYSERVFPRAAAQWLASRVELKPRLFVDGFASSNTLLWLPERFKLFADTNTFACDDRTLGQAFDVCLGRIEHGRFLDEQDVNVVLLRCSSETQPLVRSLSRDAKWALVYVDRSAVVFARRVPEHARLIEEHAPRADDLDAEAWIRATSGGLHDRVLTLGTTANVPLSLGWDEPARRILAESVRLAPDYDEGWYNLGVCQGNLGNAAKNAGRFDEAGRVWQEAIRCFQETLAIVPRQPNAVEYLRVTRHNLDVLRARLSGGGG